MSCTVPQNLFGRLADEQTGVLGYLKKISAQQKQCTTYHQLALERQDVLIVVMSSQLVEITTDTELLPAPPTSKLPYHFLLCKQLIQHNLD